MGLILALLASGFSGLQFCSGTDGDWDEVWALAQTSYLSKGGTEELEALIDSKAPCCERRVADYLVAALKGEPAGFVDCVELSSLSVGSSWAYSMALQPGDNLNRALVSSLNECPTELVGPVIERGFAEFMRATERMSSDQAVVLAEALHGRASAVWSAQNLAIAYTRQGSYQAGSGCLIEALERDMSPADRSMLQSRLSLVYWGEGGLLAARSLLGAGLCQGNSDSGIVLGLSSLERGRFDRAKTLFRSVLGHDPSQPWARKGWGLSMVPY